MKSKKNKGNSNFFIITGDVWLINRIRECKCKAFWEGNQGGEAGWQLAVYSSQIIVVVLKILATI